MLCSPQEELPSVTIQPYYRTTDYIPFAVPFIPRTYSSYWKSASPTVLHPFSLSPSPSPQTTISLFSALMSQFLLFVCCLLILFSLIVTVSYLYVVFFPRHKYSYAWSLWFPFAWNISFHHFIFSLCVSFKLKQFLVDRI